MHLPSLSLLWELPVTTFPDIFSCICHPGVVETMPEFLLILSHLFGGVQGVLMSQVTGLMQVLSLWKCCVLSWRAHNAGENEKSCCGSSPSHKACVYLTCLSQIVSASVRSVAFTEKWSEAAWELLLLKDVALELAWDAGGVCCCLAEVSGGESAACSIFWLQRVVLQVSLWSWWVAPPWEHTAVGSVVTATHPQTL